MNITLFTSLSFIIPYYRKKLYVSIEKSNNKQWPIQRPLLLSHAVGFCWHVFYSTDYCLLVQVAAMSGDARRALEICRRAAEFADYRVKQSGHTSVNRGTDHISTSHLLQSWTLDLCNLDEYIFKYYGLMTSSLHSYPIPAVYSDQTLI